MEVQRAITQGFVAIVLVLVALCGMALLLPHQMTYVEGYMLEQAHRLASGKGLYHDADAAPWIVDNFPPAWIAVLAVGVRLFGVGFTFGRVLSMLAVAALSWMMWWLMRRRGDPTWLALAIIAVLLMSPFVVRRMMFARMDLPALAFMAAGFLALVRFQDRRGVALAALAFLAAALSRQTALVAPAAACIGLWWSGARGRAVGLAAAFGAILAAAVAILHAATDGQFLHDVVLHNMGRWSLDRMVRYTGYLLGGHFILVGLGTWGTLRAARGGLQSRLLLSWWGLQVATVWTIGKPGTASNHFLPLLFVMALHAPIGLQAAAKALQGVSHRLAGLGAERCAATVMVVQALVLAVPFGAGIAHMIEIQSDEAELIAVLEDTPGPVLSENAGAALQSGHEVLLEPRTTLEQWAAGRWDDGPLRRAVEDQNFTLIVTEMFPAYRRAHDGMRFTPDVWQAIQDHYEPYHECGKWQVWRPAASE